MSDQAILTINAGSSSIKFSVYENGDQLHELAMGQVEKLGPNARFVLESPQQVTEDLGTTDHASGLHAILKHLPPFLDGREVTGVGHRIVHGGPEFTKPVQLNNAVLNHLASYEPLAPLHQPYNLSAVRAAMSAFPLAVQVGCFDTAFHRGHPWEHDTYALPRRFYDQGVRRYGFHGLSYEYVSGQLAQSAPDLAQGRVIIAHLGNGASMCGLKDGRSHCSTMGFSAVEGLAMGTRTGQIDPGVILYLQDHEGLSTQEVTNLIYRQSGLKGLSDESHDMRTLLASDRPEAAQAITYYITRIRHEIGGMAADLGGLDALVFTGGVGENSDVIRARICEGMEWLGLSLDPAANAAHRPEIGIGKVRVFAIPTDEEKVIARAVDRCLG